MEHEKLRTECGYLTVLCLFMLDEEDSGGIDFS